MSMKRYRDEDDHRPRETAHRGEDKSHNSGNPSDKPSRRRPSRSRSPIHRKRFNSSRSPPHSNRSPNSRFAGRHENGDHRSRQNNHHEHHESTSAKASNPDLEKPFVKERVNFNKSGKLAQDTNMQNGVIVKYSEPIEAAKPVEKWRLYPFKNDESLPFVEIHRKSYFLLGRDRKVVDIPLDHPSVSKQHAAIQFRKVELERKDGGKLREIRPYLMDLESSNKTYLNNQPIDPLKYYQLLEKDVVKFGFSTREYVVLIDTTDQDV